MLRSTGEQFFEVVPAASSLQPIVVQGESFDQILA
jgi:hypothetical protein